MGRAGKEDRHLRRAPIEAVVREAAEPHLTRGVTVDIGCTAPTATQPIVWRRPEIIHGLRNLIQNAVDFAPPRSISRSAGLPRRSPSGSRMTAPGFRSR